MTTVEALKLLYEKLGGNPADVADIETDAEMIDAIKDIAIPAELPSFADAGNRYALLVDDTGATKVIKWAAISEMPPAADGNVGDALIIDSEGAAAWSSIPTELPDTTGVTTGYVLTIGANGPEWAAIPTQQ